LLLGWQYVRHNTIVAGVFLVTTVNLLATGVFFVAFAPFVRHILGGSAEFYSWALTLQGVSGIAGALAMGTVSRRVGPRALISGSFLVLGLMALIEALVARQMVTVAVSLFIGFPSEFIGASQNALLQAATADAYRGRVYGAYGTVTSLTLLVGTSLTTLTADRIGIRTVLIGGSLVLLLAGATAMAVLPRRLPECDRSS
jgi:predicted MFS family arabinose efflux permease